MNRTEAHNALLAAGFLGRTDVNEVARAGLLRELYACEDADLARYDGHITFGATGVQSFYFIFG